VVVVAVETHWVRFGRFFRNFSTFFELGLSAFYEKACQEKIVSPSHQA